jgi:hypothetical protein
MATTAQDMEKTESQNHLNMIYLSTLPRRRQVTGIEARLTAELVDRLGDRLHVFLLLFVLSLRMLASNRMKDCP